MWPHFLHNRNVPRDETYIGEFKAGVKSGSGKEYHTYDESNPELTELKFEGFWENDQYFGEGILYTKKYTGDSKNFKLKEGTFKDGELDGFGKTYVTHSKDGVRFVALKYEGQFKKGSFAGKGILYEATHT